jgi:class 3 adenylate cyclase
MAEPQIQYAKTEDGVSIAYWTLGEGKPLIVTPSSPFGPSLRSWQTPEGRRWYERLAEKRRVVRYDNRGSGDSEQGHVESFENLVQDLEAVVDCLGSETVDIFGYIGGGQVAIAQVVRQPERVSRLILWCAGAAGSDISRLTSAVESGDWEAFTETWALGAFGWSGAEQARQWAKMLREAETPASVQGVLRVILGADVTDLLDQVKVPTLVMHRRELTMPGLSIAGTDAARRLASGIPQARLVLLDGDSGIPYLGDTEKAFRAIDEFLSEGEEVAAEKTELPEGMAVILFADIVESTALTEQLGDTAFREKAREMDTSLRAIIGEAGGTPVEGKLLGDGVLSVFTSAKDAIDAALRFGEAGETVGLGLHVGMHAGDVIREGDNVYGGAVNIAARIAGESEAGEVLVSDTVRSLARTSASVSFDDRGEHTLKGIDEPQRLYAVRAGN